jgi:1-acyl-sn-glycerol-3-phosphate acyltransferase
LPVVPVTHNAGYFWPRRGWLKRAGTIRVVIGPPIETEGAEPREVNERAQRWIEDTLARLVEQTQPVAPGARATTPPSS